MTWPELRERLLEPAVQRLAQGPGAALPLALSLIGGFSPNVFLDDLQRLMGQRARHLNLALVDFIVFALLQKSKT
jgi:hypothetical protein